MTKAKSRKAFLLAVVLSVVSVLFGTIGAYTAARAYASEGVEASTDTVTGYYMTIPLAGCEGKGFKNRQDKLTMYDRAWLQDNSVTFPNLKRSQHQTTVLITFPQIKYAPEGYKEETVFVNGTAVLEFPSSWSWGCNVEVISFQRLNIRESFYNLFLNKAGLDWRTVDDCYIDMTFNIMFLLGGSSNTLCDNVTPIAFTKSVHLYADELPPDVNDPDSPNFDPGTNGGTVTEDKGEAVPWLKTFYDSLSKLFGWNLSYETFLIIFWCIVGVIALALFMTLLRAIFGRR